MLTCTTLKMRTKFYFNAVLTLHCHACCSITQKMTNRSAKFEIILAFPPLLLSMRILSKFTVFKADLLQGHQIYCMDACMCALFSPEVLQAGAVKGLISATNNKTGKCIQIQWPCICNRDIQLQVVTVPEIKLTCRPLSQLVKQDHKNDTAGW